MAEKNKTQWSHMLFDTEAKQDNTRTKDISPKAIPDLTDKEKEDLRYVTEGKPEEGLHYDDDQSVTASLNFLNQNGGKQTVDMYKKYTLPNGEKKSIKVGEATPYSIGRVMENRRRGYADGLSEDEIYKTGKYKESNK